MNTSIPTTDFRHDVPAESRIDCRLNGHGFAAAQGSSCPPGRNLAMSRPFEAVRMVAWPIDLVSILERGGLLANMSDEERAKLGLDDAHWSIAAAFDCRTRVILGMSLTRDPEPSAAISCLRMVTRDEGATSDAAGTADRGCQHGMPERLVVDHGISFSTAAFTAACHDLGIPLYRAVPGVPAINERIERHLRMTVANLPTTLSGQTFSAIVERAIAAGGPEDLHLALVRWIVGIYHYAPQADLGGKTPLEMWQDDHQSGILALCATARIAPRQDKQKGCFDG